MSNEEEEEDEDEDADEDGRHYRYIRKYYKIKNQFNELIEILDRMATKPKRRRVSSSPKRNRSPIVAGKSHSGAPLPAAATGSYSGAGAPLPLPAVPPPVAGGSIGITAIAASNSPSRERNHPNKTALVETITKHLEDLKNDCPSDSDN